LLIKISFIIKIKLLNNKNRLFGGSSGSIDKGVNCAV
jgi:hypothetical protein